MTSDPGNGIIPPEDLANPTYEFRLYVLGLIDVLGQAEQVLAWPEPTATGWDQQTLLAAVKPTFGRVLELRKAMDQYIAIVNGRKNDTPPGVDARLLQQLARVRSAEVRVVHFSDMSLLYAITSRREEDLSTSTILQVVLSCCAAISIAIAYGIPIRGGIAVGIGVIMPSGELYGPALVKAHRLESSVAQCPRIVVDDGLVGLLCTTQAWSSDRAVNSVFQELGRVVRDELFATDVDGATIVHWLGDRSRSLHKKVVATDLASRAARTVQEQLRQARQRKNELLVLRYERLWAYMSRHLPAWGVEPSLNEET